MLVLNCFREVSSEAELVKHWFDCTGGIVLLTKPVGPELLPKPERLIEAAHSWGFYFHDFKSLLKLQFEGENPVNWLYQTVKVLNLFHIPLRITESSEVLKLGDFLTKFMSIRCLGRCIFNSVLHCRGGQIQCYIIDLKLICVPHIRMFTKAAATISIQSLTANMCSNQSCLKFLTSLTLLFDYRNEDLGAMFRNCRHLQRITLHGIGDYTCDILEQVPNRDTCNLNIGPYIYGCSLTSFGAEKFAALLPRFPNISILNLDLGDCCAEAVTKLVNSITHNTLEGLSLCEISFTSAAATALGRAIPEMTLLKSLELTGKEGSILHAEEIEALFGQFNKELCLNMLSFEHFHVRGNLAPLTKSFRFFPELRRLSLKRLDMDGDDLCLLLDSFRFIPNLFALSLEGNPLGHAVTSIVPHLINLPELNLLDIHNCSEEDEDYVRKAAKAVRPRLRF